jgi:hypothetical protein
VSIPSHGPRPSLTRAAAPRRRARPSLTTRPRRPRRALRRAPCGRCSASSTR